jgi:hypothetical protein
MKATYKPLDTALIKSGDNNLDNWSYIGTTYVKDEHGCNKLENNKKLNKNIIEMINIIPECQCICGVYIYNEYFIQHNESGVVCKLGSTCISKFSKDKPEFRKEKCKYCNILMHKRTMNDVHKRCQKAYDEQVEYEFKAKNNICLKCDKKIGNIGYEICFKCNFKKCTSCNKRCIKSSSKYTKCFKCHTK